MAGTTTFPKLLGKSARDPNIDKVTELQRKIAIRASEQGVPLVRVHDLPHGSGIAKQLSPGQREWLTSTTFDCKTGNPVYSKQLKQNFMESVDVMEKREAVSEVEALCERPFYRSDGDRQKSDVIERIQKKRKIRHDQALGDLSQELATVGEELSQRLTKLSDELKSFIADKEQEIEAIFQKNCVEEVLQDCNMKGLESLWMTVEELFSLKRQRVATFEDSCDELEKTRTAMVQCVLKRYATTLTNIAYLLPHEVEQVIEEEAHTINMSILGNKRMYTQLCKHLISTEYMMEKKSRQRWDELVADWQTLVCQLVDEKFSAFMSSDEVVNPEEVVMLRKKLISDVASINSERENLLKQLSTLRSSHTTTSAVYEWRESYLKLQQQLEETNAQFLLGWQNCLDKIACQYEEELNQSKDYLMSSRAVDSETKLFELLSERFVPLIEDYQSRTVDELKIVERSVEVVLAAQSAQFLSLFQYAQGAAHLWNTHLTELEQTKQTHKDGMRSLRAQHDSENQMMEANLDLVLDRLRQSSCTEELTEYLKQSLGRLEVIKERYTSFQQLLSAEAQQYPSLVQEELRKYDTSLCRYFGVGRTPSKKRKKPRGIPGKSSDSTRNTSRPIGKSVSSSKVMGRSTSSRALSRTSSTGSIRSTIVQSPLHSVIEDVISTSQGTSFYVLTHANDSFEGEACVFITQDEESEGDQVTFASEAVQLSDALFIESRNSLRASFLDHLESWKISTYQKALEDTADKEEELKTELELRLHLHEPRPSRVEDIHNTRSVELVAHQSRVDKHANAVMTSLKELKSLAEKLQTTLQEKIDQLSEELATFEAKLLSATSTFVLQKICAEAKVVFDKHLESLESVVKSHVEVVDSSLAELKQSNTAYQHSLKLFSQGGNYCQQEFEILSKRLEKLSGKISTGQKQVTRDIESHRHMSLDRSREIMSSKFDNSYYQNLDDIIFLEAISKILTNCQLKIKSEVAISDMQTQKLSEGIQHLQRLLQDCSTNDSSKSMPSASTTTNISSCLITSLLAELPGVLQAFSSRVDYLYCWASYYQGARVGPGDGVSRSVSQRSISISAVNVTKSISRYTDRGTKAGGVGAGRTLGRGDSKTVEPSTMDTKASDSPGKVLGKASVIKRKQQQQLDRRNVSFGLGGGDEDSNCFLPHIRVILASSYRDLYSMCEVYYKQKGSKPVSRPEQIQDNFQACTDHLIAKCQGYREQAETYRNNCIDKFQEQLSLLSNVLVSVSNVVLEEVESRHWSETLTKLASLKADLQGKLAELAKLKKEYMTQLRPALGHPSRTAELDQLCADENARHERAVEHITQHNTDMKEVLEEEGRKFAEELVEVTQTLLTQFNDLVAADEVLPPKKLPPSTQQLLRQLVHPQHSKDQSDCVHKSVTKPAWPAINDHCLAFGNKLTIEKLKSIPVSKKATPGHLAVIQARDKTYERYSMVCLEQLHVVAENCHVQKEDETKASVVWTTSVDKLRKLYS